MPQATGTLCACALSLSLSMSSRALAQMVVERPSLHADTVALSEAGTEARRHRTAMRTHADGSYTWTLRALDLLPQTLGAADPVRYARLMPGIQTNGEYHAGLHIQGSENCHNLITMDGVPVYNANHLLGIFSTFNAPHFQAMTLSKAPQSAADADMLGGTLTMTPHDDIPESTHLDAQAGLVSSQATLRTALSPRAALTLSARTAYINMLYSAWLRTDETQVRYSFYDTNATLLWRLAADHTLTAQGYVGGDRGAFDERYYYTRMKGRWANALGSLTWTWTPGRLTLEQRAYATTYRNRFILGMQDTRYGLTSHITTFGYSARATLGAWTWGIDFSNHNIAPQALDVDDGQRPTTDVRRQHAVTASAHAGHVWRWTPRWSLRTGVRATCFSQGGSTYMAANPNASVMYADDHVQGSVGYALRRQYLFQTGFSDAGLPTEYWMAAGNTHQPQRAHCVTASAAVYLADHRYRVSADLFYKSLAHQSEYAGSLLDYANKAYRPEAAIRHGHGYNVGGSVMITKCTGRLTGWLSYTLTRACRRFYGDEGTRCFAASHERPHEVNAVLTYALSRRLTVGGTLTYASGTPFTAPQAVALVAGNVMVRYGAYNGSRLPAYFRSDVSMTWQLPAMRGGQHALNLSFYNVTCRKNALFFSVTTHKDGSFEYEPTYFMFSLLPSLSYTLRF